MVVHACHSSYLGAEAGGSWVQDWPQQEGSRNLSPKINK
jgi:hypothetical protein